MAEYVYREIDIQPFRSGLSRLAIRKRLLLYFANEEPGEGKQDKTSRYRYCVETMADGSTLWIVRPGRRNGNDFRIEVDGHRFGRSKTPKYEHIYDDLRLKRDANPKQYAKLMTLIDAVYACTEFKPQQLVSIGKKFADVGYPCDLVVGLIKWFLIEHDMNDWNTFGRDCAFYRNIPR
ncbi:MULTISPECIES: hypothetical protein [Alicyclobacillus]|uniref:Uncharacterized protein n=1 Tax=Alicyclobacillus acidoterrestris (strain ATCC 49025 / DSM 3922 / CIP 106132 / NCIMB 13137 / GD3B) TaxID=1356854 RepID=T0DNJ2_ALIAG|nr:MULTISPECIES: hypothetical protein [Alicyclobacillus]EPZ52947.1 hypothetical protein N007_02255 [Alicyclobacillus acidoterrestris ATCC 49025]UNO49157.1 hypothetical protein K1I37_00885 [Alicyclobacillus acidoterrestris]